MVESYCFGEIVIDGEKYTSDLLLLPEGVRSNWWRREGHELCPEDLREVVSARPEVLVVGTGSSGLMAVLPQTREHLASQGIELLVQPTEDACQTYNRRSRIQRVAAALHLTC